MSSKLESQASSEGSMLGFMRRQFEKPKPVPDGVDLNGQVAIITGSNSGLGFEASRQFLRLGISHLIMGVRSQAKGDTAAEKLRGEFPEATVSVWTLDMESYDSIRSFADRCQTLPRIDIVVLNAGVQKPSFATVAGTNHEAMLQVNYLSTALLAILLLPVLKSKKASAGAIRPPTLSLVGSDLAYMYPVDMDNKSPILQQFDNPKAFDQLPTYSKTKLLVLLFVSKLADYVDPEEVLVNVTNPSMTKGTQMFQNNPVYFQKIMGVLNSMMGRPVEVAASNYVHSTVVLGKESHGSFTANWTIKPYPKTWYTGKGREYLQRLWEETLGELDFCGARKLIEGLSTS
ncbi:hypothetical protein KVR01_000581 [Diaporthe batatas]|uniref:uncharacterized protein n=1 Tax=Diaporthe batatas TaxID=748121 RepID=UPI001D04462B|nr:uncharacterized protein KVR01_000581 [Diaporthe batatas]KAG8169836.1 hypothetical protein KVR01_000581 [Diaporthe batatas]